MTKSDKTDKTTKAAPLLVRIKVQLRTNEGTGKVNKGDIMTEKDLPRDILEQKVKAQPDFFEIIKSKTTKQDIKL